MLYFPTENVSAHITRIYAFGTELMYLIEGSKYNVLIDTGSGYGSLKKKVDHILDEHNNKNPLRVFLTHGHIDHVCGAGEFINAGISVYMNPADQYIYIKHVTDEFRKTGMSLENFDGHGVYEEIRDYIPSAKFEDLKQLYSGDVFDLGGVVIEAYACPGHTLGSLVFLIQEKDGKNYLLTGDACNYCTFLFQEYSTSVEEYEENLLLLSKKMEGRYDHILLSHMDGDGYVGLIEDVCQVCEHIKNDTVDAKPYSFCGSKGLIALDCASKKGNIVYHKDRIWKKDTIIF